MCVDLVSDIADEERRCEEFAASVLLPSAAVLQFVDEVSTGEDGFSMARKVAAKFKVSIRAAAVWTFRHGMRPLLFGSAHHRFQYADSGNGNFA